MIKKGLLFLLMPLLGACSKYYYYPTYQTIPVHTKPNELSANCFLSGENHGFSLDYSLTKSLGSYVNLNTFDSYDFKQGAYLVDLGVYYYKPIGEYIKPDTKTVFSVATAYSFGENNRYLDYDHFSIGVQRVFVQPSIGFRSKFFDMGMSIRGTYLNLALDGTSYHQEEYSVSSGNYFFLEPNAFIGVGYKGVKLNFHRTLLTQIGGSSFSYYSYAPAYLSLSVQLDFDKLFR